MNRALVLSPHLDDAAFSCGGTLAMLARAGWDVVVATLFTQTVPMPQGFALACQLDKGLAADVDYMALRRAEDRAAMAALGARFIHVPLPEAPHRGYESATALFGPPHASDTIGDALRAAIGDLVHDAKPNLIFAPQAIGGHVDHVQLVHAINEIDCPVAWWRDFPYTVRASDPAEPFAAFMHSMLERAVAIDDAAFAARDAACLAYESQLGFQFGGASGLRKKLHEVGTTEHFRAKVALPV